jgi:hypothetical protein
MLLLIIIIARTSLMVVWEEGWGERRWKGGRWVRGEVLEGGVKAFTPSGLDYGPSQARNIILPYTIYTGGL